MTSEPTDNTGAHETAPVEVALEPDEHGGVTVVRGGHAQSYVAPDDPGLLVFEYVQHLALVLDAVPAGRLGVTHVGGAGLTLPRYVEHTRPGSTQIVLEPDAATTELVRRELPLPRGHRIRVRPVDGATGLAALRDDAADVVVVDAFDGEGRVPAELVTAQAFGDCARVLKPGGLLLMNLADEPGLRWAHRVAATAAEVLPHQAMLIATDVAKGKRYGNVVLVASDDALDQLDLPRRAARAPFPTTLLQGGELRRASGYTVGFGAHGHTSPAPPDPGEWRLR